MNLSCANIIVIRTLVAHLRVLLSRDHLIIPYIIIGYWFLIRYAIKHFLCLKLFLFFLLIARNATGCLNHIRLFTAWIIISIISRIVIILIECSFILCRIFILMLAASFRYNIIALLLCMSLNIVILIVPRIFLVGKDGLDSYNFFTSSIYSLLLEHSSKKDYFFKSVVSLFV